MINVRGNVRVNNGLEDRQWRSRQYTKYKSTKEVGTARESASTHKETRSIKARTEKWTGMSVRATKKFFVFVYVVPMAIRIALEVARKGGVQGGSSM